MIKKQPKKEKNMTAEITDKPVEKKSTPKKETPPPAKDKACRKKA